MEAMMTLAALLYAGLQLQGDAWTMLSAGWSTPKGGMNGPLLTDPGGAKHLFNT